MIEIRKEEPQTVGREMYNDPDFLRLAAIREARKGMNHENDSELLQLGAEFNAFNQSYEVVSSLFDTKIKNTFKIDIGEEEHKSIRTAFLEKLAVGKLNTKEFKDTAEAYRTKVTERVDEETRLAKVKANLSAEKNEGFFARAGSAFMRSIGVRSFGRGLDGPRVLHSDLTGLGVTKRFLFTAKSFDTALNDVEAAQARRSSEYAAFEQGLMGSVVEVVSKNQEFVERIKKSIAQKIKGMVDGSQSMDDVVKAKEYYQDLSSSFGEQWAKAIGNQVKSEKLDGKSIDAYIEEALMKKLGEEMTKLSEETGRNITERGAYANFTNKLEEFTATVGVEKWPAIEKMIQEATQGLKANLKSGGIKAAMKMTLLNAAVVDVRRRVGGKKYNPTREVDEVNLDPEPEPERPAPAPEREPDLAPEAGPVPPAPEPFAPKAGAAPTPEPVAGPAPVDIPTDAPVTEKQGTEAPIVEDQEPAVPESSDVPPAGSPEAAEYEELQRRLGVDAEEESVIPPAPESQATQGEEGLTPEEIRRRKAYKGYRIS